MWWAGRSVGAMRSSSIFLQLNGVDLWKTVRGGLVTFGGFILVEGLIALRTNLEICADAPADCQFNFGDLNVALPTVVTLTGMVIELMRRWLTDHNK